MCLEAVIHPSSAQSLTVKPISSHLGRNDQSTLELARQETGIFGGILLFKIHVVNSAPATTANVVIEIPDGQIQNPIPSQRAPSLFKATDIAGHEIIYVGTVGLNTLGSSITELLGTAKLVTTTNAAGSTITGVAEAVTGSQSTVFTIMPESIISSLSSPPPIFAFTTVDANGQPIVNLGQTFLKSNGSTPRAILENGISISYVTTLDSEASAIVETVGVFTRHNGSVVTSVLSFAGNSFPLALSTTTAKLPRQAIPTTTGSEASLGVLSSRGSGLVNGRTTQTSFPSYTNTAPNTSPRNLQNASVSISQESPSQTPFFTNPSVFSAPTQSLDAFAETPTSFNEVPPTTGQFIAPAFTTSNFTAHNGLSSTQAFNETASTTDSVISLRTTASMGSTSDGNATMSIYRKMTSTSESTTILGTRGSAVQVATNSAVDTTTSVTARAFSMSSAIARRNSTSSPSSAGIGGLLLAVQSDSAVMSGITALLGEQLATVSTIPSGMSILTVRSTTCSTAFAMATTTASGSTVTQIVPKLCHNGVAFFLFGWTNIPRLCSSRLALFGFLLQFIRDPLTGLCPAGVDILSGPDPTSGSADDSPEDPKDDPQDEDGKPSDIRDSSDRASSTSSPYSVTSSRSSASPASSTKTISATSVTSSACSGMKTVSGTSKACCDNSTVIGITTLCNYQIDSWVESLGPFVTTSMPIPASATPILLPGTEITVDNATLGAFFSSLASEMLAYAANLTVTTSTLSRNPSSFAPTASATAATLAAGSGLLWILQGGISAGRAKQTLLTNSATPRSTLTADSKAMSPTSTLACTQFFFFADDGPNNFICQCNDGTWNHRNKQDSYSLCPSQETTVSMTVAYNPETTIPSGVSCALVNYAPSSVQYNPFCECSNDLFFVNACPSSVAAVTTTLTLSEPPASLTAALTKGDYITPIPIPPTPPPSPTTSLCVPQCTKHVEQGGSHDLLFEVTCYCNPACGGNGRFLRV